MKNNNSLKPDSDNSPADSNSNGHPELGKAAKPSKEVFLYLSKTRLIVSAIFLMTLLCVYFFIEKSPETRTVRASDRPVSIELPDGSIVNLMRMSSLTYEESFDLSHRNVMLRGEADFKLKPSLDNPLIIQIDKAIVQATNASFNVKTEQQEVTVLVESGNVLLGKDHKMLSINPGEKGVFNTHSQEMKYFTKK